MWLLEKYFSTVATGTPPLQPKWDYQTSLDHVDSTPTVTWAFGRTLNSTMVVPEKNWNTQMRFLSTMEHNSALLYRYS